MGELGGELSGELGRELSGEERSEMSSASMFVVVRSVGKRVFFYRMIRLSGRERAALNRTLYSRYPDDWSRATRARCE